MFFVNNVKPLQPLKEELKDLTCLVESDETDIVWDILDMTCTSTKDAL